MKKLLALVLALVMTLGLATVGANAADFKDDSSIQYGEAVDVMNGIGVIEGDDNGNFNPKGTLTREQAAKIVAYMMLGQKGADSLSASAAPFTDVAADRWSAGAIAYCQSEGIIAGLGDGTFNPTGKLTGHQFAKMLLVALGYDAKLEGYVDNKDWAINVAKQAVSAGLEDDLQVVMSQDITRDQAAQMSFNTLKADMVEYSTATNVKTGDGTEVTVNAERSKTNELTAVSDRYDTRPNEADNSDKFCEVKFPDLKLTDDSGDFGEPARLWNLKGVEICKVAKSTVKTFTGEVTVGQLKSALGEDALNKSTVGGTVGTAGGSFKLYVDGNEDTTAGETALRNDILNAGSSKVATWSRSVDNTDSATLRRLTGNGVITEAYSEYNDRGGYDIVIAVKYVYVGKVTAVTPASGSDKRTVTIKALTNPSTHFGNSVDLDLEFETEDFSKDDIVLYTASHDGTDADIRSMTLATKVAGALMTGSKTDTTYADKSYYTLGGKNYNLNFIETDDVLVEVDNSYDVYLDENGYIVYTELAEEALDLSKYIVLTLAGVDSGLGTTVLANGITLAGTKVNDIKITKLDTNSITDWSRLKLFKVYEAKIDKSGNYELKTVAGAYRDYAVNATNGNTAADFAYTTGSASLATGVVGNDDTTLYTYDLGDKGVQTYKGIKNMPKVVPTSLVVTTPKAFSVANGIVTANNYNLTNVDGAGKNIGGANYQANISAAAFLTKNGRAVAGVLCVNDDSTTVLSNTTGTEDVIYVTSDAFSTGKDGDDTVWTFEAIKNGKVTTVSTTDAGTAGTIITNGKGFYLVGSYDGDYIDGIDVSIDALADYSANGLSSPLQVLSTDTYVAYEDVDTYGANVDVTSGSFKFERLDNTGAVVGTDSVALDSNCAFYEVSKKGVVTPKDSDTIEKDVYKALYYFVIEKNSSGSDTLVAVICQKT